MLHNICDTGRRKGQNVSFEKCTMLKSSRSSPTSFHSTLLSAIKNGLSTRKYPIYSIKNKRLDRTTAWT